MMGFQARPRQRTTSISCWGPPSPRAARFVFDAAIVLAAMLRIVEGGRPRCRVDEHC
ncbi:hypothetical protein AKJ09_02248 [Labilithrix luteola]|uniref:Uncharacterized protein n=1 Tax=Labilithrix luteola TaxID=1391654 RepID=A0A0K1PR43_9BACT|nr:hypothetical protein AKJ09_02248 [Labilithrix luteola]